MAAQQQVDTAAQCERCLCYTCKLHDKCPEGCILCTMEAWHITTACDVKEEFNDDGSK
jgi:hypothetical protein